MTSSSRGGGKSQPPLSDERRQSRCAVVASTIIEWYDFGLYNIATGLVFPCLFSPLSIRSSARSTPSW